MSHEKAAALQNALHITGASLRACPRALMAIALAAAAGGAHAQFGGTYERAGSTVGHELGRALSGDKNPYASSIAATMGQLLGSQFGKSLDESGRIEREAQERARADAAYEAERRKLDPAWLPTQGVSYGTAADRAAVGMQQWSSNFYASHQARMAELQREWERNNPQQASR